MKRLSGLSTALLFLLGCGNPESVNLASGPSFAQDGLLASTASSCNESFTAPLTLTKTAGYGPVITFVAATTTAAGGQILSAGATLEERCSELKAHFSGSPLKDGSKIVPNKFSLDIHFDATGEQEEEMLLGKAVNLRVQRSSLSFTDGSFKNSLTDLELRCSGTASVTCQVKEIGDYKTCASYDIKYYDQCTFKSQLLLFSFSDHKRAQLDTIGNLSISTENGAYIKFNKMSWMGLD